jgi:hypothetical protein
LDTPQNKLVGRFVLVLFNTCSNKYADRSNSKSTFKVYSDHADTWNNSHDDTGKWCAFYPDVPHEVLMVDNGMRVTLTFKIFAKDEVTQPLTNNSQESKTTELVNYLGKLGSGYGILLAQAYSSRDNTYKGRDHIIIEALKEMNKQFIVVPVLVHVKIESYKGYYDGGEITKMYKVHLIDIVGCCSTTNNNNAAQSLSKIKFISLSTGYLWNRDYSQGFTKRKTPTTYVTCWRTP